jgi:hypothetical protein
LYHIWSDFSRSNALYPIVALSIAFELERYSPDISSARGTAALKAALQPTIRVTLVSGRYT